MASEIEGSGFRAFAAVVVGLDQGFLTFLSLRPPFITIKSLCPLDFEIYLLNVHILIILIN